MSGLAAAFAAVRGQEHAVAALAGRLARTGGSGSTLIVGPEGVGRHLLAMCAAKAILGTEGAALVDAGRHPDLVSLTPDAGIDGVREAIIALQRRPAMAPRQVLVLRDADRMSNEAHNALLKTLEEPPAGAAVFVVAEDPSRLPETVVSRCAVVRARALTEEEVAAVL
jgi:DNA polymerase III gamma/tau subunit